MKKYLILLVFYCGCNWRQAPTQYQDIWVNSPLDYLYINSDTIRLASTFDPVSHSSKYTIKNDTLIAKGNKLYCKYQEKCTIKFLLNCKKDKIAIKPLPQPSNSIHFFTADENFIPEEDRFIPQAWDSVIIKRSQPTAYGMRTFSIIRVNNKGYIHLQAI